MRRREARAAAIAAEAARRGARFGPWLSVAAAGWRDAAQRHFAAEIAERRPFLWLPIAAGLGVVLYFAADVEPNPIAPAAALAAFAVSAMLARGRPVAFAILLGGAAIFAGFSAALWRAARVEAPRLERILVAEIAGYVETRDDRPEGARLLIRLVSVAGLAPEATPFRARVTTPQRPLAQAGDFVRASARLLPPPEPARPGGYDFGRDAFFKRIGAVGHAPGRVVAAESAFAPPWDLRFFAAIDRQRNALTGRIVDAIGGQAGALAAALVTGKRDLITEETNEALRAAGVYHIVSVSGLHMVLAAGAFFWTARALLALFPMLALAWPVKKIAAALAMIGATAYCLFTGSEVATERSLIMILVMLGAVLADRPALAMRNLAIAALIVLAREPETLLGPSFQMSFAAVAGLVAFAEWRRRGSGIEPAAKGGWFPRLSDRLWIAIVLLIATTLVATFATAPYAAYHFQRLNPWGLIGNALALPFVSMIVMPAAVFGVLLWPFGLDFHVWTIMGWGTGPVIAVARAVGGLSGAAAPVRAFGAGALLVATFALCWFVVWRTPLRWLALAPAALALMLALRAAPMDVYLARGGQGAAYRGSDGRLVILGNVSRFDAQFWLQADGDARRATEPSLKTGTACDRLGCVGTDRSGLVIAWVRDPRAFPEDCRRAQLIVTPLSAPPWCREPMIADRAVFDRHGAMALRFGGGEPQVFVARAPGESRLWLPPPRPPREEIAARSDPAAGREGGALRPPVRSSPPRSEPYPEDGDPDQ